MHPTLFTRLTTADVSQGDLQWVISSVYDRIGEA